jgi:hypothetical protein
VGLERAIRS